MQIKVEELEFNVIKISLSGRFDAEGVGEIRGEFTNALQVEDKLVIVEMSGVELLASSGIRLLLAGAKVLSANRGKLVVAAAPSHVEYPMIVSGVDTVIPIFRTVEKALTAL